MNVIEFIGVLNYRNLRRSFQNKFATYVQSSNIWIWKSRQSVSERINKHYSVGCKTQCPDKLEENVLSFYDFEKCHM